MSVRDQAAWLAACGRFGDAGVWRQGGTRAAETVRATGCWAKVVFRPSGTDLRPRRKGSAVGGRGEGSADVAKRGELCGRGMRNIGDCPALGQLAIIQGVQGIKGVPCNVSQTFRRGVRSFGRCGHHKEGPEM